MTDERKICRECRQQVRIQYTMATLKAFRDQKLDPREWPSDQPPLFRCPTHGLLAWHQITHGEPGSLPPAPPEGEQTCLPT